MADAGVPWMSWGTRPTFFDAPSAAHADLRWRADAFLAATPDSVMSPVVEPLCAFSWGYDARNGVPSPVPVTVDGLRRWADARPLLAGHSPGWTFR